MSNTAEQLNRFRTGFPDLKVIAAATPACGIEVLTPEQIKSAIARWDEYLAAPGAEICKFVPASGAASRMFKAFFEFVGGDTDTPAPGSPVAEVLANLDRLPFLADLDEVLRRKYAKDSKALMAEGRNRDVVDGILAADGLNYGALPKALLKFHSYGEAVARKPLEEHMMEGAQTASDAEGNVNLHFTVSTNHRRLFEEEISRAIPTMEALTGKKFHVTLSEQKPETDTIAGDAAHPGEPFHDENGREVYRPGGHGALIENLNDLDSAVVFIKNIDNVVPDRRRDDTILWKKVLAGRLIQAHDAIEKFLRDLADGTADRDAIIRFLEKDLNTNDPRFHTLRGTELDALLRAKLDRPLRVAGMVKNEGEPGGGPYIAVNPDGSSSPQILESSQISEPYKKLMADATHFNPVDLVCYLKNPEGAKYDLRSHVDPDTGFISRKSYHGRDLLALELPGLWNGSMSDWNTIFVEVPLSTFNPVKTLNDLLRPAHQ